MALGFAYLNILLVFIEEADRESGYLILSSQQLQAKLSKSMPNITIRIQILLP